MTYRERGRQADSREEGLSCEYGAWIAIGLAVVALAFLVFPLVQVQTELRLANEQVVQARARMAELERVVANLKTELDAANRARTQLQSGLDEATEY